LLAAADIGLPPALPVGTIAAVAIGELSGCVIVHRARLEPARP